MPLRALLAVVAVAGCTSAGGTYRPPVGDVDGGAARDLAGTPPADLAGSPSPDLAGAPGDLTSASPDLTEPPDLARAPDLAGPCDGPDRCGVQAPICCARVAIGAGAPPNCPIQSVQAACAATCTTSLPAQCPGTSTVALCRKATDCTDFNYPHCCTYKGGGGPSITGCVSDAFKTVLMLPCF